MLTGEDREQIEALARQLRADAVRMTSAAGSGHPTSAMSAADLAAVLLARHFRYDVAAPRDPGNDRFVLSKGHASPLYYAMLRAAGAIPDEELGTYRSFGSRLEGHPTPVLPCVDVATGSLGQGLPIAVGMALAARCIGQTEMRVWVLCGDSELAEGSVAEAFEHAAYYELDNLVAIVDVNRLGQRGETMHGWDLRFYSRLLDAYGWRAIEVDGHDPVAIDEALREASRATGTPAAVIAQTVKGKGVHAVEDAPGMHGKPLDDAEAAIRELGARDTIRIALAKPAAASTADTSREPAGDAEPAWPEYRLGDSVPTRVAYGEALAALGRERRDVVALDGEVGNSTFAERFEQAHPERFFEMFIAEQQLVAAAVGMQALDLVPFASTFAAFLTRAYDFVRMAAVSRANIRLCGSHAGVSIGEDGPSQMGLEDIAMIQTVHGSTVLYPCDANQTGDLVRAMADIPGVSYLRTTRGAYPVIYEAGERFPVGGSRLVRSNAQDDVTVIAAGVTVHEALQAATLLAADDVHVRVLDCYSVKPIDEDAVCRAAAETQAIVTVEDHWPEGGLGDAVLATLAARSMQTRVVKLAVSGMPGSGTPAELLRAAGIDHEAIATSVRSLVRDIHHVAT